MKRLFIETELCRRLTAGEMPDEYARQMQKDIMNGLGKTIAGTGGLCKIRCGREGQGKRGGWRVVFADYPAYGVVVLIVAFRKNVQENLAPGQVRELRQIKGTMDIEMERKYGKEE